MKFDPLLIEFWNTRTPKQLATYAEDGGDGCDIASDDFLDFLKTKDITTAKKVPMGEYVRKKGKKYGWIKLDKAQMDVGSLTDDELDLMVKQGLKPYLKKDVKKFIADNNLEEELKWVPHSWVVLNNTIYDPSGFFPNKKGQFDKKVRSKNKLSERYKIFS